MIFSTKRQAGRPQTVRVRQSQDVKPYWSDGQASTRSPTRCFKRKAAAVYRASRSHSRRHRAQHNGEPDRRPDLVGHTGVATRRPASRTSLITTAVAVRARIRDRGRARQYFPESTYYRTLQTLLDAKSVTLEILHAAAGQETSPARCGTRSTLSRSVRNGPEWGTNVTWPQTNVFSDISSGNLPQVCWVIPDGLDSDHPGYARDNGPSWVAQGRQRDRSKLVLG